MALATWPLLYICTYVALLAAIGTRCTSLSVWEKEDIISYRVMLRYYGGAPFNIQINFLLWCILLCRFQTVQTALLRPVRRKWFRCQIIKWLRRYFKNVSNLYAVWHVLIEFNAVLVITYKNTTYIRKYI